MFKVYNKCNVMKRNPDILLSFVIGFNITWFIKLRLYLYNGFNLDLGEYKVNFKYEFLNMKCLTQITLPKNFKIFHIYIEVCTSFLH